MCYSAQVEAEFREYQRLTGSDMDIGTYVRTFWWNQDRGAVRRPKVPRAVERDLLANGPGEVAELIRRWDAWEVDRLTRELFSQRRRVADAERALQTRETRKAREDVRIGTNKARAAQARLEVLKGKESSGDRRIYPGMHCPVVVSENGRPVVRLMRYQCRPPGKPASFDRRFPGTYSARRDSLEGFWSDLFGQCHAVMIADRFYENVEIGGKNQVLEFAPRTGEPMYIACLWSEWRDPGGREPDLLSFAAITDEPEPEVAATGHDRTIINIRPEYLDAWLNPDPRDLAGLHAILHDRRHPYYEHRIAA